MDGEVHGDAPEDDPDRKASERASIDDLDLDAQIEDLAAALQFDDALDEEEDEDDDLAEEAEIEELDADLEPPRLYLVVDGRVHVIDQDRFVIGRVSNLSDLTIVDANISRQHCAIERRDGEFVVKDLGSTNGIEIDGVRVDDHVIEEGETLVLSGHEIQCTFDPPEVAAEAPVVVEEPFHTEPAAPVVTAEFPPVPQVDYDEPEPEPMPMGAPVVHEHAPVPASPWPPASFEERVELRLEGLAQEVAQMRVAMQQLLAHMEALKVDALAQLIQSRLQQARRGRS